MKWVHNLGDPNTIVFEDQHCPRCKRTLHRWQLDTHCRECSEQIKIEQRAEKKRIHLKSLKELTLEQRVSEIEEWIYDHKINHPTKDFIMR